MHPGCPSPIRPRLPARRRPVSARGGHRCRPLRVVQEPSRTSRGPGTSTPVCRCAGIGTPRAPSRPGPGHQVSPPPRRSAGQPRRPRRSVAANHEVTPPPPQGGSRPGAGPGRARSSCGSRTRPPSGARPRSWHRRRIPRDGSPAPGWPSRRRATPSTSRYQGMLSFRILLVLRPEVGLGAGQGRPHR